MFWRHGGTKQPFFAVLVHGRLPSTMPIDREAPQRTHDAMAPQLSCLYNSISFTQHALRRWGKGPRKAGLVLNLLVRTPLPTKSGPSSGLVIQLLPSQEIVHRGVHNSAVTPTPQHSTRQLLGQSHPPHPGGEPPTDRNGHGQTY